MSLVQTQMFGAAPVVVADFTVRETQPFNHEEWHLTLGGQWELVEAAKRAAHDSAIVEHEGTGI